MLIIGISGKAEHGKTTSAKILKEEIEKYNQSLKVEILPLAKSLKDSATKLGWDGKKDAKGRRLLQELSWPIKHYYGENCYAKWVLEKAQEQQLDVVIVDDVRMYAEVEYFEEYTLEHDDTNLMLIRVNRPNYQSGLTSEQLKDLSETQLDTFKRFDCYIDNSSSLSDLQTELTQKLWLKIEEKISLETNKEENSKKVYILLNETSGKNHNIYEINNVYSCKDDGLKALNEIVTKIKESISASNICIDLNGYFSYSTTDDLFIKTLRLVEKEVI